MTNLKSKLKACGERQGVIARKCGLSDAMLSLYSNGLRVPPDVLARLADVLDCEPAELVGNVEEVTA